MQGGQSLFRNCVSKRAVGEGGRTSRSLALETSGGASHSSVANLVRRREQRCKNLCPFLPPARLLYLSQVAKALPMADKETFHLQGGAECFSLLTQGNRLVASVRSCKNCMCSSGSRNPAADPGRICVRSCSSDRRKTTGPKSANHSFRSTFITIRVVDGFRGPSRVKPFLYGPCLQYLSRSHTTATPPPKHTTFYGESYHQTGIAPNNNQKHEKHEKCLSGTLLRWGFVGATHRQCRVHRPKRSNRASPVFPDKLTVQQRKIVVSCSMNLRRVDNVHSIAESRL